MRILVFTNTFAPHVGGVARSVERFTLAYRGLGHRVVVVAPRFDGTRDEETDVVRFPAVQRFNGSDFSVPVPVPGLLRARVTELAPEVVHSHHPFLLGDTALRVAAERNVPVVFTHHTMYERYTHYVPGDSPRMQRFAIDLATGYGNLCDAVVAPSESVAEILRARGVETPVVVIPTGVDPGRFRAGDRDAGRRRVGIPADAFVVGHVGRLAPEKNLDFLAGVLARFAAGDPSVRVLFVGEGPSGEAVRAAFGRCGAAAQLVMTGVLDGSPLADAYRAMDVFAFASRTETQGMVLAEAMAAGVPVVAVDAPGAREVVRDGSNGRLLRDEEADAFLEALSWVRRRQAAAPGSFDEATAETAARFSIDGCARRALALYEDLVREGAARKRVAGSPWSAARRRLGEEWKIVRNIAAAAGDAWLARGREGQ